MKNLFIVLAAGKSTRMKSSTSKVLHKICDKPMLAIVISKVLNKNYNSIPSDIVVVCNENNLGEINQLIQNENFNNQNNSDRVFTCIQPEANGTGGAVRVAIEFLNLQSKQNYNNLCVLYADAPLFEQQTIEAIIGNKNPNQITFAGFNENNPSLHYGRIVCSDKSQDCDKIIKIVEFKDANEQEKNITIFNSGIVGGCYESFCKTVYKIDNNNSKNEYYLTQIAEICNNQGIDCKYILCNKNESLGANTMQELCELENIMQNTIRDKMMQNGVRIIDPKSVFFSFDTTIQPDVTIEPNVIFKGKIVIQRGCNIKSFCYLEDSQIKQNCSIGPFARFRGGVNIDESCKIGNFVEIKSSSLASGVKASHLAYIGDGEVGNNSNIGAGVVFCNYDGKNKHKTKINENCFIGSNSSLVAPLECKKNSTIAAGSVVVEDVPEECLYIARPRPSIIKNWFLRKKQKN
jgi:bifunctional UDP-N-acetylglucosamine pyrophosphorylase/glucosamine-1-phosphate N-acetyltransferase